MFELNDRVALVTGSSRGIGRGIALGLAKAGAHVIVNSLNITEKSYELVREIKALGRMSAAIQADVSKEEEVSGLFAQIQHEFGRLDILVNNAGKSRVETIFEMTLDSWREILDNNLTSTFLCSKYAMDLMSKQNYGRIIQITSVSAHQGAIHGHAHYAASKSGQVALSKSLARTAAPYGITVNSVAPGIIDTELLHYIHGEEKLKELGKSVPLGLGEPEDIAAAVVFLSSEEAHYITGITLDVNGGMYFR